LLSRAGQTNEKIFPDKPLAKTSHKETPLPSLFAKQDLFIASILGSISYLAPFTSLFPYLTSFCFYFPI